MSESGCCIESFLSGEPFIHQFIQNFIIKILIIGWGCFIDIQQADCRIEEAVRFRFDRDIHGAAGFKIVSFQIPQLPLGAGHHVSEAFCVAACLDAAGTSAGRLTDDDGASFPCNEGEKVSAGESVTGRQYTVVEIVPDFLILLIIGIAAAVLLNRRINFLENTD